MPNRTNDELGKAFAVGTKIEYNGKSYEVIESNGYVDKEDFYEHSSKRKSYVIPYNFPLNTRRGFRTIYYLMKLSQHDMTTVIKDIIAVRHDGINVITNICDKLEKENDYILYSLRGGYNDCMLYRMIVCYIE